jgi:hypothetical protein
MLSSLNPMSERGRGHRPAITAVWYVLGAALGGLVLGLGCAVAAIGVDRFDLPRAAAFAVAAGAAIVGVYSDSRFGRSLPDHPRQVDETWMVRYRRWIYASGYGVQIGTGFATYIMTAAVYLTAVLAVLTGPAGAVVVGLAFGVVRGLAITVTAGATTPDRLRALLRRVELLAPASVAVLVAVQGAVAVTAAYAAGGSVGALAVLVAVAAPAIIAPVAARRRGLVRA